MSDKKISQLPLGNPSLNSIIPIVVDGTTSQTTIDHIKDLISAFDVYVTGGTYNTSSGIITFTNSAGSTFDVSMPSSATASYWSPGTGSNAIIVTNSGCLASGTNSLAEGLNTQAINNVSHAEGQGTIANGLISHAEGYFTQANGDFGSHAEGYSAIAGGQSSHAEGYQTQANGPYSHVEGNGSVANNTCAHAEGFQTVASGGNSHAEGDSTTASGDFSHAEGGSTTASGFTSHAGGFESQANGDYSFIHGSGSTVNAHHSIVLGSGITGDSVNTTYVANIVSKRVMGTPQFSNDPLGEDGSFTFAGSTFFWKDGGIWYRIDGNGSW